MSWLILFAASLFTYVDAANALVTCQYMVNPSPVTYVTECALYNGSASAASPYANYILNDCSVDSMAPASVQIAITFLPLTDPACAASVQCTLNGKTVSVNQSWCFYSTAHGPGCGSCQNRKCLSTGSFDTSSTNSYPTCTPANCTLADGTVILSGTGKTAYGPPDATGNCSSGNRNCTDGNLDGDATLTKGSCPSPLPTASATATDVDIDGGPSGGPCPISGQIQWNGTVVQWCDGKYWHDSSGTTCTSCSSDEKPVAGRIETGNGLPVYWNGSKWISMEGAQIQGPCVDQKPKSFKAFGTAPPVELRYCDSSGKLWKINGSTGSLGTSNP